MNETVKNIIERSSCNKFKPEQLTKEQLDTIVAAGLNAPTGMNLQTPRFVVVSNKEMIKKLSGMNAKVIGNADIDPFYGAPNVILVLAKKECTYMQDGALAMGNMLNAIYAMGLGGRWINRCTEMFETEEGKALLKEWGITEDVAGIGCCICGYPDMELTTKEKIGGRVWYVD